MVSGLYEPRRTWLHAVPAGAKLALLGLASTFLFFLSSPALLILAASVSAAVYLSLGSTSRSGRRAVLLSAVVSSSIGLVHVWGGNYGTAAAAALPLFSASALTVSFTLTTRFDAVLIALDRGLAPLRSLGVNTDRLSLALALMLRFADHFFVQWQKLDESYRLRTNRSGGLLLFAPLCFRLLEASIRIADSLDLRFGDAPGESDHASRTIPPQ